MALSHPWGQTPATVRGLSCPLGGQTPHGQQRYRPQSVGVASPPAL